MATPPQNPVPWIVRRAQKFGGRGPRPRQTLPSIIEEGGAVPRALEKELNLEHRSPLGGGGWAALLGAGEEVAWGKLLRLPPEIARAALPFIDQEQRAVVRAELATARRRRWRRRAGAHA